MPVNTYLVEAPDGVVIVDGMLTVTDAGRVRGELDRIGKPVLGAIVTHAHPDHYAGMAHVPHRRLAYDTRRIGPRRKGTPREFW